MIDTQRLGALLRAWMRDDALLERQRAVPVAALPPLAAIGAEAGDLEPAAARQQAAGKPALPGVPNASPEARAPATAGTGAPAAAELELSAAGRILLAALGPSATARGDASSPQVDGQPLASNASRGSAEAALPSGDRTVPGTRADADPASPRTDDGARLASPRTGVEGARALVPVPPHSEFATDRLALQLKDAVEYSGVFYESHLAQWADDRRPRALLAREPQAGWSDEAARVPSGAPSQHDSAMLARPLLAEQLAVLESGRFQWQGELWPGQRGALHLEEEPHDDRGHDGAHAPGSRWRLSLSLDLAGLGRVEARLRLSGDDLDVALSGRPATASLLTGAAPALRDALAGRSLTLATLKMTDAPGA